MEPTVEEKSELCRSCGECCKYLVLDVLKPKGIDDAITLEWMTFRGLEVIKTMENTWRVRVDIRCPYLDSNDGYRCSVYSTRPKNCERFDGRFMKKYGLKCAWEKFE